MAKKKELIFFFAIFILKSVEAKIETEAANMLKRVLGKDLEVSAIGLGCMD